MLPDSQPRSSCYADVRLLLASFEKYDWLERYVDTIVSFLLVEKQAVLKKGKHLRGDESKMLSQEGNEYALSALQFEEQRRVIYNGAVIGIFSSIEQIFYSFCFGARREKNVDYEYTAMRGLGIGRAEKYLKEVLDLTLPSNPQTKKLYEVVRIVRNAVVHADGVIAEENQWAKLHDYTKSHPHDLELEDWSKIVRVTPMFLVSTLKLHSLICKEIDEYITTSSNP